jgi:ABC-2 type transport system ATP-binding protein
MDRGMLNASRSKGSRLMPAAIETSKLTKWYGHNSRGVIDVDLVVEAGQIFGFLGPNGAGKSTTIRLLLDLIRPTSGTARVLGLDVHRDRLAIDRRVSYVPGELSLYGDLTGRQLLTYLGNLQGTVDEAYRDKLVERLELDTSRRVKTLSRGNKQKVGLVAAFMIRPELLILDEPTAGLDPFIQLEFEHLCEEARAEGRTVFISSHQLPEVEHLCDRVGIIREGRLLAVESIATLKERALRKLEIEFGGAVDPAAFAGLPGVQDVVIEKGVLRCAVMGSLDALVKVAARFEVVNLRSIETSLEEIFMAYYGAGDATVVGKEAGDAAA